ncbi:MAG TPA: glycosyltransferase family A protein [Allosphingosinicella sp.]|nr:glycosyltransferase family A protein [Allosphingosinicella sp.]
MARTVKVAICTPCHGDPRMDFVLSLVGLVTHRLESVDVRLFVIRSSVLPHARNVLVQQAREWGADRLLWIDADMTFPPDALQRLLARDADVIGANYRRRHGNHGPTAFIGQNAVVTTKEKAEAGLVERVSALGLGFCLMRAAIFDRLREPWFLFGYDSGRKLPITEDSFLFANLNAAGVPILLDHGLSWEIGHVGETILTNN